MDYRKEAEPHLARACLFGSIDEQRRKIKVCLREAEYV